MDITLEEIRDLVPDHIYERGRDYYRLGRVQLIEVEDRHFKAVVSGSDDYIVDVSEQGNGWVFAHCNCPYWDDCKHIVAAMLAAKDYYNGSLVKEDLAYSGWKFYLAQSDRKGSKAPSTKPNSQLIFTLDPGETEFVIQPQKALIKQDDSLGVLRNLNYGDYSDSQIARSRKDNLALSWLEKSQSTRTFYYDDNYGKPNVYYFKYGDDVGILLELLRDSFVCLPGNKSVGKRIEFQEQRLGIEFRIIDEDGNARLHPYLIFKEHEEILDQRYRILSSNPIWLLQEQRLYELEGLRQASYLIPFTREPYEVVIPKQEVPDFLTAITKQPDLIEHLRLPDDARKETVSDFTEKRLYLQEFDEGVRVALKFCYRTVEVDFQDTRMNLWGALPEESVFYRVERNIDEEKKALNELLATQIKMTRGGVISTRKNKILLWLLEDVPRLIKAGFTVFGEQDLRNFKVNRSTAQVRVAVESGIDWFDLKVEIDFGGILLSLKELRKALKRKSRYVKLSDGSTAKLPEGWLNRFRHVVNLSGSQDESVKLSHFHVTLIDELFADASQKNFDKGFNEKLQQLKGFQGIEAVSQPKSLKGTLRPYQGAGLSWLHFLKEFRFGGCLADDMGLGKTVQALALLLSLKNNGRTGPALVVTPTSVVFNWLNEIEHFGPTLRVLNLTGSDRQRTRKTYDDVDIVLTSYGTLRRDIIFLKDIQFDYVILDESQFIKNPLSQTAKAVKLLQGKNRLALTGTPVENNTLELWSLFSFLNPGLLGNLNYFKEAFAKPIEQDRDKEMITLLQKTVFPFILRRTKEEVEKDLPPKVENTIYCNMKGSHEKLYNQWRDYYRAALLKQIAEVGFDKSRMNVLEGLTKLRQIACHPALIQTGFRGKVGKFEAFKDHVDEILAEGHKILVFSQFVRMLKIVRDHFDAAKINYEYLDGKTRDRKSCVERFQNQDDCKVFLISLRAGGIGLNLTAAEYVIHYDPWWNPAVEMQATDRSHRIGQTKHVFVYKMISKGTVEEKILELQSRKKDLVSNIISTDSAFFKHLTVEDIEVLFS